MAYEAQQIRIPGLQFTGAYASTNQYKFVKLTAAKQVQVCNGTTDKPIGVLQNCPQQYEAASVCAIGVTKVQGAANLAAGNLIGTDGSGQAAAYTATDTTKYITGQIIDDNDATNGYATALIDCTGRTLA